MTLSSPDTPPSVTPTEALERLNQGNQRFLAGKGRYPHHHRHSGATAIKPQHPIACILGCSDARVPPQLLFDQQVGELFMVRVAGNIIDRLVLASIEYAVLVLKTPLVMVLGHQACGAVQAARDQDHHEGHLGALIKQIKPVFQRCADPDDIDEAVRLNVQEVVHKLHKDPSLLPLVQAGSLGIKGSYYDLERGGVQLLDPLYPADPA